MHHSWPDMLSNGTNGLVRNSNSDSMLSSSKSVFEDKSSNSWKIPTLPGSRSSSKATLWLASKPSRRALLILLLLVLSTCMFSSLHLLLKQSSNSSRFSLLHQQPPNLRIISQERGAVGQKLGTADGDPAAKPAAGGTLGQQQQHLLPALQQAQQQQMQQQQWHTGPARADMQLPGLLQHTAPTAAVHAYDNADALKAGQQQHRQHPEQAANKDHPSGKGTSQQHQHEGQQQPAKVASKLVLAPASTVAPGTSSSSEDGELRSTADTAAAAAVPATNDSTSVYISAGGIAPTRLQYPVWWHGPIWSGSGYGSEAINYVLSLLRTGRLAPADIWAAHHGDVEREHVVESLAPADRSELQYLESLPARYRDSGRAAVVVCHSMATNWAYPEPMWSAGAQCPPNPREYGWLYTIGRTMFETDRLPALFVPRLNAMNEIWVPSEWQKQSFIASGVPADKIVVVPEGINTTLYDPAAYAPLDLQAVAQLVFGRTWNDKVQEKQKRQLQQEEDHQQQQQQHAGVDEPQQQQQRRQGSKEEVQRPSRVEDQIGDIIQQQQEQQQKKKRKKFTFISSFKWEQRKGWDILLQAYLSEFTINDDVELFILTKPYESSGSSFKEKMRSWADKLYGSTSSYDNAWEQARIKGQLPLQKGQDGGPWVGYKPGVVEDEGGSISYNSASAGSGKLAAALGRGASSALAPKRRPVPDRRRLLLQQGQGDTAMQQQQGLGAGWCGANCTGGSQGHDSWIGLKWQSHHGASTPHHQQHQQDDWSNYVADVIQRTKQFAAAGAPGHVRLRQRRQQQQQRCRSLQTTIDLLLPGYGDSSQGAASPQASSSRGDSITAADPIAAAAEDAAAQYPTLYVVDSHISDADFPRFYKAGDAFVLPSRGEGWGRPHVEAMSMGLPVISTNWSGITAYLDDKVGYPIAVEKLVQIQGGSEVVWWFRGLKWAQPSVKHLRQLMRRVYENREEAAAKGAAARALMVEKYSPVAIADILVKEFKRIERLIP